MRGEILKGDQVPRARVMVVLCRAGDLISSEAGVNRWRKAHDPE